jgi:hypothetical protein
MRRSTRYNRPGLSGSSRSAMLLSADGDGSTLTLDFTTGVLDSRLTFTRASTTATYINSSGYVTTAGTNVPRFDYDPTTLAPRGLLIEAAATNLLCWSESFATSGGTTNWTYNGNSGATVTETNPAGGSSSFQFRENSGSGPLSQTVTTVSTSPYTYSFWVRASVFNSVTTTQIQVGIFTTAFQTVSISKISGPGSVSGTGLCTVSGLSLTEWTKVQVTTTGNIGATSASVMLYAQTASFELDRSLLIWGAQVEAGSGASSYIPTGASQATRNADECSMTGTNFSSWYTQSQGTLLVAGRTSARYVDSAGFDFPAILTVDSNNHIGAAVWNGVAYGIVRAGGAFRLNYATLATVNNNSAFKTAIAFANADYAGVANNGSPVTASSGSPPTTLNTLALGSNRAGTGNAYFGHVSLVKFWPTRLTNAQLQSLTT